MYSLFASPPTTKIQYENRMTNESDPRVFFAAERTLLAWIRTGIATFGLGFVIARFGLFMRMLQGAELSSPAVSTWIGAGFVVLGTMMIGLASWQNGNFVKSLRSIDIPYKYSAKLSLAMAWLLVGAGVALSIYLVLNSNPQMQPLKQENRESTDRLVP